MGERVVSTTHRPQRAPRSWLSGGRRRRHTLLVLGVGAAALASLLATDADSAATTDGDVYVRGGEVFQDNCAACHGTRAEGGIGGGELAGPQIDTLDVNYWDLTVRTGRMPIVAPSVGVRTDVLGADDRDALIVYARERFDLPGELPTVESGDPARGQELFVRNCAACHGAAADGGISGAAVRVPPLTGLDGVAIHQATRIGPFEMPGFDPAILDDDAIDDLVGYLDLAAQTPRSPAGVREVDQISSALFAGGLALAGAVVVLVVARARRWSPHEPTGAHADPPFDPRE